MRVTLIAAMSIDGFIARREGERSFDWTSPEDKQFYIQNIKTAGAVVMGSKTIQTFHKFPKGLTFAVYTRHPESFENPRPGVIEAFGTTSSPEETLAELTRRGHQEVMIAGGASIYAMFMEAGVVDRLLLTVEPVVFGQGVQLFGRHVGVEKWKLVQVHQLSPQTIVLEYVRIHRHESIS